MKKEPIVEEDNDFISVEELTRENNEDYVEVYELENSCKRGKLYIRPIRSTKELEEISSVASRIQRGKRAVKSLVDVSDADIYNGVVLHYCIVKPKLNLDQAIALRNTLGPESRMVAVKIFKMSGMDPKRFQEEEDKLKEDPFSALDSLDLRGILASSPVRSQSDTDTDA